MLLFSNNRFITLNAEIIDIELTDQIKSNNEILNEFDQVQLEHDQLNAKFSKLIKRKREIDKSLELGKLVSSNQVQSYRALAQIARSVPLRVNFTN